MPTIRPVSDLRNYTDVLNDVREGSPVFLTRNGRGAYALVDMRDYDREAALQTLARELDEGMRSGEEEGWLTASEVREHLRIRRESREACAS